MFAQDNSLTLTVSQLNNQVKNLLEECFERVTVEAEISNFVQAASGHWYFSLKDERAQVSCAMFAGANRLVRQKPSNGDKVTVRANVSLYTARGNYQLLVQSMQPAGLGQWQVAYAELHRKLAAEGLLDPEKKRNLPYFPKRLGIISSMKAAALQDIVRTVQRRFPSMPVSIYPATVQGEQAEPELISALQLAQEDNRCDLLIIARGGGSIEDLWAFNLETVARAIATCTIPTISAIGHETDFTIADFVADLRASTPTAAAEQATPEHSAIVAVLLDSERRMTAAIRQRVNIAEQNIDQYTALLQHPGKTIQLRQQELEQLTQKIQWSMHSRLNQSNNQLQLLHTQLKQLDYRKPLQRGYALAVNNTGSAISSADAAIAADLFALEFHDGIVQVQTRSLKKTELKTKNITS